jgi:hypothetical protein
MGLSSSKTKTSSTSTSTPNVPSWIQGPYQGFAGQLGGLISGANSTPPTPIGPTNLQQQAFTGAGNLTPNQGIMDAINGSRGLMGYTPSNVEAGQLANTDLSAYMNPYEDSVVQGTLGDIERMRQGAISGNQASATGAGAYGGSRHGVVDAETNRGALDIAGQTAAGLRQSGYQNAQTMALQDIMNRLGADQFNVSSGLQGAGLRLNAANQTGTLGMASDANSRANLGLQAELGGQQRDINTQTDPNEMRMRQLAQISALLGTLQGYPIGQTVNSSGTTSSSPSGLQVLGSIAQTASALFPSDRRLKENIEPLGEDAKGLKWYAYDYIWGGARQVGVMADEAPAHAVVMHPSGYAMVDYGAL